MSKNKSDLQLGEEKEYIKPLAAPCRTIGADAPFRWLAKGWSDFKTVPRLSLSYGLAMMVISMIITYVAYSAHSIVLAIAMIAGFFFIGPVLAIGLYSMSRQIDNGVPPKFLRCLKEGKKHISNELILSFVFLIVFLIWARAASMVHIFFPSISSMELMDWVKFLSIGSAVGAIFATIVFCLGAFSIPMMMDRNVDAITAIITSINAVLHNKLVMILWGFMIVTIVLVGIATLFIGFAILLPIVGHASWHAYREVIDAEQWELGPGLGVVQK
ncbi:hypothetical protein MNBD_GAMMA01-1703 [hydrothermal vent metagenome]|uniref:Cytochrome c oxidase, subunit I n=1 Tax=hydrothermal vent metagenome TaxID=652676 RepID=A0A3B0UR09_9ZZZZ